MCSNRTETRSILARSKEYHRYYDCRKHHHGKAGCANNKHLRAKTIESLIWELVSGLLQDPDRLREGLEEMIEAERAEMCEDPEQKAKA